MRLGLNQTLSHTSPAQWADDLSAMHVKATVFPLQPGAPEKQIAAYVDEAKAQDIMIAEVGIWNSPFSTENAAEARKIAKDKLRLADQVGARCCVNVSGAVGPVWYGAYKENYGKDTFRRNVEWIRELLEEVDPKNTYFTLELMQWMLPATAEEYLRILQAVDHPRFAVHMDVVNLINDPWKYFHHDQLIDEAFLLLGDRVRSCHFKDLTMDQAMGVQFREVPCTEGIVDFVHYAACANAADPEMPMLIEHLPDDDAYRASAKKLYELLKNAGVAIKE